MSGAGHEPVEHAEAHAPPHGVAAGHGGAPAAPQKPPIPQVPASKHYDFWGPLAPGSQSRARIIPGNQNPQGRRDTGVAVLNGIHPRLHLEQPRPEERVASQHAIGAIWAERVYNVPRLRKAVEQYVPQLRNGGWHRSIDPFLHQAYNLRAQSLDADNVWHEIFRLIPRDLFPGGHGHEAHGPGTGGGGGGTDGGGTGGGSTGGIRRRRSRTPVIQFNPVINVNPHIGGARVENVGNPTFENVGSPHLENIGNPSGFGNLRNVGNAHAASGRGRINSPDYIASPQDPRARRPRPRGPQQPPVRVDEIVDDVQDAEFRVQPVPAIRPRPALGGPAAFDAFAPEPARPAFPLPPRALQGRVPLALPAPSEPTHSMPASDAARHGVPAPIVQTESPDVRLQRQLAEVLFHPEFAGPRQREARHTMGKEMDRYSEEVQRLETHMRYSRDLFTVPNYNALAARVLQLTPESPQRRHLTSAIIRGMLEHYANHEVGPETAERLRPHFDRVVRQWNPHDLVEMMHQDPRRLVALIHRQHGGPTA